MHAHATCISTTSVTLPLLSHQSKASQTSVHAISQPDRLEVVAVFCPNCLLQKSIHGPYVNHDFLTDKHVELTHSTITNIPDNCVYEWGTFSAFTYTSSTHVYKQHRCFQTHRSVWEQYSAVVWIIFQISTHISWMHYVFMYVNRSTKKHYKIPRKGKLH